EIEAIAEAGVERRLRLLIELGAADAGDAVELRRPGAPAADEDLAGQEVVADREVVVAELLAGGLEDAAGQDLAEQLVAHLGLAVNALDEEVLGDVIADAGAVDPARTEVLRRVRSGEQTDLEIVRRELGLVDVAPVDLRNDDLLGVGCRRVGGEGADAGCAEQDRQR